MDEREYREGVEGSFPERQAAPQTDADKAALDRMDITDASAVEVGPSDGEDAPHVEEEDDTPLPEGGDEAMLEAQRYGFSPDEARILAANGLVTRIRTMRESLESRAASADSGQARAPAEKPVPDEAVSSDAGLAETENGADHLALFGREPFLAGLVEGALEVLAQLGGGRLPAHRGAQSIEPALARSGRLFATGVGRLGPARGAGAPARTGGIRVAHLASVSFAIRAPMVRRAGGSCQFAPSPLSSA